MRIEHEILDPPEAILDPLDIRIRVEELKALKPGWLDGKGLVPSPAGLDWLADSFVALDSEELPRPYLFPAPDGSVLAEWHQKPWSLSLEINLEAKTGEWHALNLENEFEESATLNLQSVAGWSVLARSVRGHGSESA